MKEGLWGYLLIFMGIFIIVVLFFVYNYTSSNENDYYLAKEAAEAAMLESVDRGIYYEEKEVVIVKEKFVENFIRRFAEMTNINRSYKIEFFDIYEDPPKASIRITTSTGEHAFNDDVADAPVVTILDGIIELKED